MTGVGYDKMRTRNPWAVSAMARESLLFGNEYRNKVAAERDVDRLYNAFNFAFDPFPDSNPRIDAILTPLLYEQFPYQESQFPELARTQALFNDPSLGAAIEWESLFGLELNDAVRASLVLHAWVSHNGGRFDPRLFDLENMQRIFSHAVPREHLEVVARLLTTTVEEARITNQSVTAMPAHLRRYAFNPLIARPLVDLGRAGIWAPQSMLVSRAFQPANLFYRGIACWGKPFADQLGLRNEAYIGKQLRVIAGDALHGEIIYGKSREKSVDWIWVTPKAVVLVECKSARLTLGARAGDASLPAIVDRALGHAKQQLNRTAELIRARVSPFDEIPSDRPIVGVTVTMEPFYLGNSSMAYPVTEPSIPVTAMSLRDLERWVCLPPREAVERLLDVLGDSEKRSWPFAQALGTFKDLVRNPILDDAWRSYDFIKDR